MRVDIIPSGDYTLVPEWVPRDDEDEWLRIHGDLDEGRDDA